MSERIFITGIGTGVGKTVTAACITEALKADYWKPVQTGLLEGADTDTIKELLSNDVSVCHPELWKLELPASPHLAAREEQVKIEPGAIISRAADLQPVGRRLVIEGAGGLMVPLNDDYFTADLIRELGAKAIVVAQNYLGSINHALLTAGMLRRLGIHVLGWVFTGDYHSNEDDVVKWSGYPKIGRIPRAQHVDKSFVQQQAQLLSANLHSLLA
ncbi:dethiobiotin synthetase [Chitinophaga terrae (ex Kim and Jung 2007)]|uniref:ATP-dependent dethiobiotin synthetase BioD n=1 Tax=Chitinophaga terrae (ex Kim and Jung 2007) TaxID=408074 RepID=A0A1H4CE02_9BACT|nr:dethiobiotin synthase [Chitinophaga terrae (ex Kim and Jung 2007)]MDQ0109421.1 dethiobiotin synthetase [Chitinophaga terrae (ex Kim and Jung 2007)]GEP88923.1 ATP-dependent dethiobiotin synthetase BioD [Chitinophaga terrae (ex Kim and Jung 2007)]SEA58616.1 dethiobiotin synthetase [Chitinophaga terrae (ex Kim and Jung 2007)]